jgi:hypothetical protein
LTQQRPNPAFHLRNGPFLWREVWLQEAQGVFIKISLGKPGGNTEGVVQSLQYNAVLVLGGTMLAGGVANMAC